MQIPRNIDDYTKLLEDRTPFTMANIGGDGEFLVINGWRGENSDGYVGTEEKQRELSQVLLEPRLTFHGWNPGRLDSDKRHNAEAWCAYHGINVPFWEKGFQDPDFGKAEINVRWVHKEIISSANVNGRLNGFLQALRNRYLIVIGPGWLKPEFTHEVLRSAAVIPTLLTWADRDVIEDEVRQALAQAPRDAVVTWSLGYITKALMWRLQPDFPTVTQVDVGACWDPYCDHPNRHGYKRDSWQEAKAKNLEGL